MVAVALRGAVQDPMRSSRRVTISCGVFRVRGAGSSSTVTAAARGPRGWSSTVNFTRAPLTRSIPGGRAEPWTRRSPPVSRLSSPSLRSGSNHRTTPVTPTAHSPTWSTTSHRRLPAAVHPDQGGRGSSGQGDGPAGGEVAGELLVLVGGESHPEVGEGVFHQPADLRDRSALLGGGQSP